MTQLKLKRGFEKRITEDEKRSPLSFSHHKWVAKDRRGMISHWFGGTKSHLGTFSPTDVTSKCFPSHIFPNRNFFVEGGGWEKGFGPRVYEEVGFFLVLKSESPSRIQKHCESESCRDYMFTETLEVG